MKLPENIREDEALESLKWTGKSSHRKLLSYIKKANNLGLKPRLCKDVCLVLDKEYFLELRELIMTGKI